MDAKTLGNMPAAPVQAFASDGALIGNFYPGMTLRQAFAKAALQGLIANERWFMNVVNAHMRLEDAGVGEQKVAEAAVAAADALLAELAKDQP